AFEFAKISATDDRHNWPAVYITHGNIERMIRVEIRNFPHRQSGQDTQFAISFTQHRSKLARGNSVPTGTMPPDEYVLCFNSVQLLHGLSDGLFGIQYQVWRLAHGIFDPENIFLSLFFHRGQVEAVLPGQHVEYRNRLKST